MNNSNSKKQIPITQQITMTWKPKLLAMAVASSLAVISGLVSTSAQASDLQIYEGASAGKPTVTLMLDMSSSMNSIDDWKPGSRLSKPHPNKGNIDRCRKVDRGRIFTEDPTIDYPFSRDYCYFADHDVAGGLRKQYSRLAELKMGLYDLVTSPELEGNVYLGIGTYPNYTSSGSMHIPTKLLDATHKNTLIEFIKRLDGGTTPQTPIANAYAEVAAYVLGTNTTGATHSGFSDSNPDTKSGGQYNSPTRRGECAGNGIYFLTDGYPNYGEDTHDLMNEALGPQSITAICKDATGWSCTKELSQKLLSPENIKETSIVTATVGFGGAFFGVTDTETCRAAGRNDIRETCEWGVEAGGGFYFAKDGQAVTNSVKDLIGKLQGDVEPVATGTISIPLDSLGTFKSRGFAYLPILEPKPGNNKLWNGNLKKYHVENATLKGDDPSKNFVFKDTLGQFAKNTWDIWNKVATEKPDKAKPQFGGTFQNVFKNSDNERNLFVNSAGSLANLKVISNKPSANFDTLSGYDNEQKSALLHFMGYQAPTGATINRSTTLPAKDAALKNIGGVLHSVPQLVTTDVKLKDNGQFSDDKNDRNDYLLYGSMDGALHMVNDKTGQETFTFVPKQILDLQPAALTGNHTTKNGGIPYGVDAPWETYVSYGIKPDTKKYEANQIFAMGGLRMGGSTYYALDITNVNEPKMIYSVGSNYANRLQDPSLTVVKGIKNDVEITVGSTTVESAAEPQKAYARMGQTWAKPSVGYVKSGGKKVMVNFLPGGYDMCYEDPQFKLNTVYTDPTKVSCSNKASAQGNAMYMVQVGQEKERSTDFEITDNGNLLWWASNEGASATDTGSTSRATTLQYSKHADLKHSIVTQVRTLDRNYDGLTDHIYFSDLGGQVWRVDINNNKDTDNFKVDRVVKVLDVSDQVAGDDAPPRFYERPLITFYNGEYDYTDTDGASGTYNGVMAMVSVGTGDRSNPVKAVRSKPDALYSFIDKDITRQDLFEYGSATHDIHMRTPNNKADKLAELTFTDTDIGSGSIAGIKGKMQSNAVQGWYMPFTHWLGTESTTSDGKYKLKMFNEPDALANILILSTYNPDKGSTAATCSAGVKGQTQRERACLPYGVCFDKDGTATSVRSTEAAGVGITDNFITQYDGTSVFTSVRNRCEGDECKPKVICPDGECDIPGFDTCTGPTCGPASGVRTDQAINPLSWMEH